VAVFRIKIYEDKMTDDRFVTISPQAFKAKVAPSRGKGLHWVTDVNVEIPLKLKVSGAGSESPITVTQ
jgi:hypothetical protein